MVTSLIVLAVLILLGAIAALPQGRRWSYDRSEGMSLILLITAILFLTGRLRQ